MEYCFCNEQPFLWRIKNLIMKMVFGGSKKMAESAEVSERAAVLLDTYGNSILRYAYTYMHNMSDAEDVLQETLIRFIKAEPKFENKAHEKAWLLRVAANICKNNLKYNKSHQTDELNEMLAEENKDDLSFVWEAVKSLPEMSRETIHLYYYEGCTTAEIAEILGRNESTVRSDLYRGRNRLREILKEAYDFEI